MQANVEPARRNPLCDNSEQAQSSHMDFRIQGKPEQARTPPTSRVAVQLEVTLAASLGGCGDTFDVSAAQGTLSVHFRQKAQRPKNKITKYKHMVLNT